MNEEDGYFSNFVKDIDKFSNEKLCNIIVVSRYLGILKEQAILSMQELATRREKGDPFMFEMFIENEEKKLPDFKIDLKKKMTLGMDLSVLRDLK